MLDWRTGGVADAGRSRAVVIVAGLAVAIAWARIDIFALICTSIASVEIEPVDGVKAAAVLEKVPQSRSLCLPRAANVSLEQILRGQEHGRHGDDA